MKHQRRLRTSLRSCQNSAFYTLASSTGLLGALAIALWCSTVTANSTDEQLGSHKWLSERHGCGLTWLIRGSLFLVRCFGVLLMSYYTTGGRGGNSVERGDSSPEAQLMSRCNDSTTVTIAGCGDASGRSEFNMLQNRVDSAAEPHAGMLSEAFGGLVAVDNGVDNPGYLTAIHQVGIVDYL